MKKPLTTAIPLFALLAWLPIHADCPPHRSDSKTAMPKKAPVIHKQVTVQEPEPFWHDLHWFE